jgi:hypothetical protein
LYNCVTYKHGIFSISFVNFQSNKHSFKPTLNFTSASSSWLSLYECSTTTSLPFVVGYMMEAQKKKS